MKMKGQQINEENDEGDDEIRAVFVESDDDSEVSDSDRDSDSD